MTTNRLIFLTDGAPPPSAEGVGDILVVPGAETSARWLELPGGGAAQARAAAAFLLADELAGGDPHIALGPATEGPRLAVAVDAQRLQGWLDEAAGYGVKPAAVVPDYLLLPEPEGDELVAAEFGPLLAVRGERLAFSAERDLAETILEGRPYRLLSEEELAAHAVEPQVDLLQGDFAHRQPGVTPRQWRRLAIWAALALVSPLILTLAAAARDEVIARDLRAKAEAAAALAAPGASDPLAAVEGRMAALQAADAFPALAADFYAAVEAVPGMQMDMLVYGEDGALRTSLAYGAYSDMDGLRAAAAKSGVELEETSTLTEGERISSEIVVRRRP